MNHQSYENTAIVKYNQSAADYSAQYKSYFNKTAESILEMCRVVFDAKSNLKSKIEFESFCQEIGFDKSSASISKMYKVGQKYSFLKEHIEHLPSKWTTLYRLVQMSDDEFICAIEDKKINPFMTANELSNLTPSTKTKISKWKKDAETINQGVQLMNFKIINLENINPDSRSKLLKEISKLCAEYECNFTNEEN